MEIGFVVPGKPMGKARPRVARGHAYTPRGTVEYEKNVRYAYINATEPGERMFPDGVPLMVNVDAVFPIPKSWNKTKTAQARAGQLVPITKPDWDNIGKIVCDALNGLAYRDDAQIAQATVTKRYGERGFVVVYIREAV